MNRPYTKRFQLLTTIMTQTAGLSLGNVRQLSEQKTVDVYMMFLSENPHLHVYRDQIKLLSCSKTNNLNRLVILIE